MIENIVLAITNAFTEFTQSETFVNFMGSIVDKLEEIDLQQYLTAFVDFIMALING